MKLLQLILLLLTIFLEATIVQPQECQKLLTPNNGEYRNSSFIRIDTCPSSNTYNKIFVKSGILITMNDYIFSSRPISFDTAITINGIDSTYDSVKTAFENLQSKFGSFTF